MTDKLRLIVTYKCSRKCAGCCNRSLPQEPVPMNLKRVLRHPAKEVYITGGEPLLVDSSRLRKFFAKLRYAGKKVFVYSAESRFYQDWRYIWDDIDGVTMTIHTPSDMRQFWDFLSHMKVSGYLPDETKSLRLNVFREAAKSSCLNPALFPGWNVKMMEWSENCSVPKGEDFGEMVML